jgi:hypothetical protein
MSEPLIDVTAAPHAYKTSWAYDAVDDNYVLVLENAAGEPFAFASYKLEQWRRILATLDEAERQRVNPQ